MPCVEAGYDHRSHLSIFLSAIEPFVDFHVIPAIDGFRTTGLLACQGCGLLFLLDIPARLGAGMPKKCGRRTWAYPTVRDGTFLGMGANGIEFEITTTTGDPYSGKESKVGTLVVKKTGISWRPSIRGRAPARTWTWDELTALYRRP